uniref:Fucosyltransferase n=1 Tax=Stomoxys calcitrans TaxID=35570 RepID=A0A1I8PEN6_STOCA
MFASSQGEPLLRKNSVASIANGSSHTRVNVTEIERYEQMQHRRCKLKLFLAILGALSVTGFLAWLYIDHTVPEFNQYRLVKSFAQADLNSSSGSSSNSNGKDQLRIILLWNSFFGDTRWSLPDDVVDPSYFRQDLKCPISQCVITNKRDLFPQLSMYDAILFHTAQPYSVINRVPTQRSRRQLYVFALMEPPGETKHILSDENDFYNLTMTYRTDSDIVWAYNWFVDKETNMRILPMEHPKWRQVPMFYNDTTIWNLWPKKTKMAAWFVSHCKTLSRREELTAELQKYMDVDVYGKCGTFSCQQGSPECDRLLDEKYKFYFSFENSLCIDYITEKLYRIMGLNIIPVVFGGADYKQFLPPYSYINAEDYATPAELANYLMYLSERPIEYMRYFWWREHYELQFYSPFCELCQRLHQPQYFLKTQSYSNIEQWWLQGSCRFKSRIAF